MSTRLYIVRDKLSGKYRLIHASSQAQALGFAARSQFEIKVPSPLEAVEHTKGGVQVEDATTAQAELPTE